MKRVKRVISAIIAICMIAVMLPAQIALATDQGNPDDYIKGRVTSIDKVPESYKGHIWEYEDCSSDSSTPYDYKITVYQRNMSASRWQTAISYNPADVKLVSYGSGYEYSDSDFGGDLTTEVDTNDTFFEYGTVTSDMVGSSGSSLIGQSLNTAGLFMQATKAYSQIVLSDTEYCQLLKFFSTQNITAAFTQKKWINDATGAKYETAKNPTSGEAGVGYMYTMPSNKTIKLFSVFFKKASDTAVAGADTFKPYYNVVNKFHGGVGIITNADASQNYLDEGIYLAGFPVKAAAPVTVTVPVQNKSGQPLSGATVELYDNQACTGSPVATATTGSDGNAVLSNITANSSYYYKVYVGDESQYNTKTGLGPIEVKESNVSATAVQLLLKTEVEYSVNVTVTNADTDETINGAAITVDGTAAGVTTANGGKAEVQTTAGSHNFGATLSGYTCTPTQLNVTSGTNNVTVKLVPPRASVTLPSVLDGDGQPVADAKFTIRLTNGTAAAWGESQTFAAGSAAQIPVNCEFEVVLSSPGDYSAAPLYLKTGASASTPGQLYTNKTMSDSDKLTDSNVTANRIGDPYYNVVIDKGTTDGTYTAKVTLRNINAMTGTFGLRYDKDVFELAATDGFKLNTNDLELYETDAAGTGYKVKATTQNTASDNVGYHVFSWQGKTDDSGLPTPFDTMTAEKDVATYTFKLKANKTEADITSDAFSVMPFDKTESAKAFVDNYGYGMDAGAREFLNTFWRYCDTDNDETSPAEGRLAASKAIDNGFYQVFQNYSIGNSTPGICADVMTKIDNKLEPQSAVLVFEVVDENGAAVEGADVTLSGGGLTADTVITTDSTGIAKINVDVSAGDVTYNYIIDCLGYWDMPNTKSVTIPKTDPYQTKIVNETLETKIYHTPVLKALDGTTDITDASLSGNAYGYNGRDFYFNISPAPGHTFNQPNPNKITVTLKDANGYDVDYLAEFVPAENMYKVPKEQIFGSKNDNTIDSTNPNANGFKSSDFIIKIEQSMIDVSNDKYIVKAMAGTNGKVSYTADTSDTDNGGTVDGTPTNSEVIVKDVEPTKNVGKFTFEADAPNYMVEKVYINGVRVTDYDGDTQFDYTFTNVTRDENIAVTFWDGNTPSQESVITLVVGDKGTANVTAPTPAEAVKNDTKMYLFPSNGTLTFTTAADTGYELNKVMQEVNGGSATDITPTGSTPVTVTSSAADNVVVYVTFKAIGADNTFTVKVKSYVKSGDGTIAPIGILTYNKYDSPTYTLTATGNDSRATAVDVNGTEISLGGQFTSTTYQLINLQQDTELGAIFSETAYILHGIVDLGQGAASPLSNAAPNTGAKITCTRVGDPTPVVRWSESLRSGAKFEVPLAKGTWTITVSKKGYLNYTITHYEVTGTVADMYFGDDTATPSESNIKPIVPVIGNTSGTGLSVSLGDAGMVGSALRAGVAPAAKLKADVDDDGSVMATSDMVYIKQNYGSRNITETYDQFKAK